VECAANPHHHNSDRALQPGDMIIMDGGALHNGYASDITRTVALGDPGPEARAIYDLVLAANAAGRAAVHPGANGEEIDRAARAVIEAGGYGSQFLHRTGHGLGLAIHEPPFIVAGSREPLAVGTTFTVEPGIYVDGLGGVRIEDNLVITADGGESLTSFERELIVVSV
jgi:Xaa-Pro dipeptidase